LESIACAIGATACRAGRKLAGIGRHKRAMDVKK
jgi:hypothetical protein